jgi:hypothetical protein
VIDLWNVWWALSVLESRLRRYTRRMYRETVHCVDAPKDMDVLLTTLFLHFDSRIGRVDRRGSYSL